MMDKRSEQIILSGQLMDFMKEIGSSKTYSVEENMNLTKIDFALALACLKEDHRELDKLIEEWENIEKGNVSGRALTFWERYCLNSIRKL
jgi:hypothetical protein